MKMNYKVKTVSHWGGHVREWVGSESEQIEWARNENSCGYIEGYATHGGDDGHKDHPCFDDDGEQVSGATVATLEDAMAWFGHDVQSITVEEIVGD